jgi:hypothetical protein
MMVPLVIIPLPASSMSWSFCARTGLPAIAFGGMLGATVMDTVSNHSCLSELVAFKTAW